jgi:RNA polymerase sigma-70 factor (ECF subfamily)
MDLYLFFDKIEQFTFKGSFEGWAKVINNALQKFQRCSLYGVINEAIIEENVEIEDENISIDYLLQIIQELPDQYRLVFSLYVLDGYSHKGSCSNVTNYYWNNKVKSR